MTHLIKITASGPRASGKTTAIRQIKAALQENGWVCSTEDISHAAFEARRTGKPAAWLVEEIAPLVEPPTARRRRVLARIRPGRARPWLLSGGTLLLLGAAAVTLVMLAIPIFYLWGGSS